MGESRVDHATLAFRLVLAEASEQEQARVDALMALWQRTVFAATWPSPNEAPRTLTNSHGESALPIFSGIDTLEVGANRFNWREPDGSLRFREMPAREALRYAMARQVNFVVLDVGFEHAVEFALEEFEPLVAQREPTLLGASSREREAAVREAVRRSNRPPGSMPPTAAGAERVGSGPQVIQTRAAQASRLADLPPPPAPNQQRSAPHSSQPPRAATPARAPAVHAPPAAGTAAGASRSQAASGPQMKQSLAPPQAAGAPRPKMASGPQLKQSAPPQPPLAAGATPSSRAPGTSRAPSPQAASGPQLKQSTPAAPQPSAAGWPNPNPIVPIAPIATASPTPSMSPDLLRQQPQSGPRLRSPLPEPPPPLAAAPAEADATQRPSARPISGSELIAHAPYQHADSPEMHAAHAAPLPKSAPPRGDMRKPQPPSSSAIETQRRLPVRTTPLPAASSAQPTLPSGSPLSTPTPIPSGLPPPTPGPRRRPTTPPLQLSAAAQPQPETKPRQQTAAMFTQPASSTPAAEAKPPRQRPTTPLQLSISAEALFTPDALPPQEPSNHQYAQTPISYAPEPPPRRPTTPLQLSASGESGASALQQQETPPPTAARPQRATTPLQLTAAEQPPLSSPEARAILPTARPPRSVPAHQHPRPAAELRRTPPPVPEAAKARAPIEEPAPPPKPPAGRRRRDDEPTLAERPNRINTQRGMQASVPDAALEALSHELRNFPEVEWACVLFDETEVPLIGVRVDPSFLNRVADITDAILDTGERQSVTLQVLLLNSQDQVKNARRNGRAFYPWPQEE